jgi:hypothetical protein
MTFSKPASPPPGNSEPSEPMPEPRGPVPAPCPQGGHSPARPSSESQIARMKAVNLAHARYLKNPTTLDTAPITEADKARCRAYQPPYSWEPHPFAPFQLTNAGADARRIQKRIKDLEVRDATPVREPLVGKGWRIEENAADNRISIITFDAIPGPAVRGRLKAAGTTSLDVVLASSCGESSERLEGALDLTEIGSRHETAADSLLGGLAQQIGGDWLPCTVGECPGWRGHRYGAEPNPLTGGNVRVMEDHTLRNAKPAAAPLGRDRQVQLFRQSIGQAVERQRRLVREHAATLEPQPRDHHLLVVNRGKMDKTVDSPPHTYDTTSPDMLEKQLGRIACLRGLLGREMAALGAGSPVEAVPTGLIRDRCHLTNSNHGFRFVQWGYRGGDRTKDASLRLRRGAAAQIGREPEVRHACFDGIEGPAYH